MKVDGVGMGLWFVTYVSGAIQLVPVPLDSVTNEELTRTGSINWNVL